MKKAVVYTRVSTNEQSVEGVSLEMQESKAKAYCHFNDLVIKNIFSDTASGKTSKRTGLQSALGNCKKGDTLIVYSLSRLSRSVMDTLAIADDLNQRGIDLVSLSERIDTSTPAGRLVLTVLSGMNQWEREQLAVRTRDALQTKRARGERTGAIPYGYQLAEDGVHLIKDNMEQVMINLAKELKAEGKSLRQIADRLTLEGFVPKRGKRFYAQTIKNLLAFQPAAVFETAKPIAIENEAQAVLAF
jgi:DNA invertase Pin-like site-specific DNA recombinase